MGPGSAFAETVIGPAKGRTRWLTWPERRIEKSASCFTLILMKSLYFEALAHLVFKWRFDHLVGAVAVRSRALCEMTPC